MESLNNLWTDYLTSQGYSGQYNTALNECLSEQVGVDAFTYHTFDLWGMFFQSKGCGNLYEYLGSLGHTQEHLSDRLRESLIDGDLFEVAPPSCTSCLGAWTGDLAASFEAQPATISGACGHSVSVADADVNSGLFIASMQAANAFQITWPASELRIFAADMTKLQATSAAGHSVDSANIIIYDITDGHHSIAGGYSAYGSAITKISLATQDSTSASVDSTVDATSTSSIVCIGISGDGRVFTFGGNAATDGYEAVPTFRYNPSDSFLLGMSNSTAFVGSYTSGFEAELIMDADSLAAAINLPDMSADGITVVKDFCGNVI